MEWFRNSKYVSIKTSPSHSLRSRTGMSRSEGSQKNDYLYKRFFTPFRMTIKMRMMGFYIHMLKNNSAISAELLSLLSLFATTYRGGYIVSSLFLGPVLLPFDGGGEFGPLFFSSFFSRSPPAAAPKKFYEIQSHKIWKLWQEFEIPVSRT